ncbi:hemerythrin family protein [bacterium]|nr:hemerythrin family protein [bacterium]MBU1884143.1 hemerythrin family protein [bacterium]
MLAENIKWNDQYSLGIANIDLQHKKLFEIVGKIFALKDHTHVKEEIRTILYELTDYVKVHFDDEEAFMKSIEYPDLAYHHELHEQIKTSVSMILQDPKRLDVIQTKMRVIAKRALIDHILEEDTKFQQYYFNLLKNKKLPIPDEDIIDLDIV